MAPIPRTWTRLRACRGAALLTASLSRDCNPTPRTTSRQSQDRDKVPEHWPKPSRPHFKPGRQDLNPGEAVAGRNVLSRNGLVHCDKGILLLNVGKDAVYAERLCCWVAGADSMRFFSLPVAIRPNILKSLIKDQNGCPKVAGLFPSMTKCPNQANP